MSQAAKILKEVTRKIPSEDPAENEIDPEECQRLVAEAAYYRAEKRGFAPGYEEVDWLEAEQDVMAAMSD